VSIYTGNGWEIRCGRWQDSPLETCDHVISDPPYDQETHAGARHRINGVFQPRAFIGFDPLSTEGMAEMIAGASIALRWIVFFCAIEQAGDYRRIAKAAGLDYVRTGWAWRSVPMPQLSGDRPGVPGDAIAIIHPKGRKRWNCGGKCARWEMPQIRHTVTGRNHETEKPVPLMLDLVAAFTDPGDLVWDPYCGSGTTGVACLRLGRRFIGHEMQPHYAKVAAERLAAEERGLTLQAARAGQTSIFDTMEES
jgi:site-specific DNA-methyltransferase (adenine-specific)